MKVKVGIIGVGTVGMGALELIQQQGSFFSSKLDIDIEIAAVCAKTNEELEPVNIPGALKTIVAEDICSHSDIQVVLELAGGYELPKAWITMALQNKKHVITANKALLAKHGADLFPLAAANNCYLMFEAAVGGGIPIIRAMKESLIANDINGLACIINGTANYILSEMTFNGLDFDIALSKAQKYGYAESDPSFDIEGTDSAHKIALLASLSYGGYVDFTQMSVEGITKISKLDVDMAKELGFVIKLLGIIKQTKSGRISADVYPALIKKDHQLAAVNDVVNAVYIKSSAAGPLLLTGAGAGRYPTASSVISDLITVCQYLKSNNGQGRYLDYINRENTLPLVPIDELETEFYLRLTTKDETGVLAKIAGVLAEHNISIDSVLQKPAHEKERVPIIFLTHVARNKDVSQALKKIDQLNISTAPTQMLRFYQ